MMGVLLSVMLSVLWGVMLGDKQYCVCQQLVVILRVMVCVMLGFMLSVM